MASLPPIAAGQSLTPAEFSFRSLEPVLSSFWKTYKPHIQGALAGAGIGAGSMALHNVMSDDTENPDSSPIRDVLTGAGLGGIAGLGAGAMYKGVTAPSDRSGLERFGNHVGASVLSPIGAGAAAAWGPKITSGAKATLDGFQKQTAGRLEELKTLLNESAAKVPITASSPSGYALGSDTALQGRLKSHINSLVGNSSPGNRFTRFLGMNHSTPAVDHAVLDKLMGFSKTPGINANILAQLDEVPKHIRNAYLQSAKNQGLARSAVNKFHSGNTWRRASLGGLGGMALPWMIRSLASKEQ